MSVTVIPDIVNDMISVIISCAENETSTSTSRRNIIVEAKFELADYFNRCNFPSNQTLSRHNSPGHEELDAIIARFGLNQKQAARQMLIWKKSKHKIDGHVFTMSSESIASRINDRLPLSPEELVHQTIESMIPSKAKKEDSGLFKFSLARSSVKMDVFLRQVSSYLFVDDDIQEQKRDLVNEILSLLCDIIFSYATIISENVQKNLGIIDKTKFLFVVERENMIRSLHSNWEHLLFLLFDFQIDKLSAKRLLVVIEMVLFIDWSHLHYSRDHPSIIIIIPPNEIEIHPYSTDILYYTTGFILQRLFVAKIEKGSFKY